MNPEKRDKWSTMASPARSSAPHSHYGTKPYRDEPTH